MQMLRQGAKKFLGEFDDYAAEHRVADIDLDEGFLGPNYVACRRDDRQLIDRISLGDRAG
jgi:hypothetical protein